MICWRLLLVVPPLACLSLGTVARVAGSDQLEPTQVQPADGSTESNKPPSTAPARDPQRPDPKPTLSPLHTFLGIDPTNDKFEPGNGQRRRGGSPPGKTRAVTPQAVAGADAAPSQANTVSQDRSVAVGRNSADSGDPDAMPFTKSAEEVRAAIVDALQRGDQGALASLLSTWGQGSGYERLLETTRQYSLILYLLCLIYPLAIFSSESLQWFARRYETGLTDRDRRYYGRRLRRRLMLAAVLTGTIVLFWWGSAHNFWWERPQQLALFAAAVIALGLTSAVLRIIIRRAAARYPVLVIRDLYQKQVELQEEVEELRKRLHSFRFAGGM